MRCFPEVMERRLVCISLDLFSCGVGAALPFLVERREVWIARGIGRGIGSE